MESGLLFGSSSQAVQLKKLTRLIALRERFVFTRYSDGELYMMLGKEIRLTPEGAWIDGQQVNSQRYEDHDCKTFFPDVDKDIIRALEDSYRYTETNYIIGLPYPCCVGEKLFSMLINRYGLPQLRSTANLLINCNYPYFVQKTWPIIQTRNIFLIANERADLRHIPNLIDFLGLGNDCGRDFKELKEKLLTRIDACKAGKELVILCAASYISNILGASIAKHHKDVTFIDIGTALHPLLGLGLIREYLVKYWRSTSDRFEGHICSCI